VACGTGKDGVGKEGACAGAYDGPYGDMGGGEVGSGNVGFGGEMYDWTGGEGDVGWEGGPM